MIAPFRGCLQFDLRVNVSPLECRDAKQKKWPVTVVTSREAKTIACRGVTAEISLALFWGETALQSKHEALFLAGHELQSQEMPESRI
jgi:hypothetical protein